MCRRLALHDGDAVRRDALVARLAGLGRCPVTAGFVRSERLRDLVVNASPAGMNAKATRCRWTWSTWRPAGFVACVVTMPAVPPLIAAARARGGSGTSTGSDMFARVRDLIVEFLVKAETPTGGR